MKQEVNFYRLGSVEEQAKRNGSSGGQSAGNMEKNDRIEFTDWVVDGDSVYVPLTSLCSKMDLTMEDMLSDEMLEILNGIKRRTGVFPIRKIEVETVISI